MMPCMTIQPEHVLKRKPVFVVRQSDAERSFWLPPFPTNSDDTLVCRSMNGPNDLSISNHGMEYR